MTELATVTKIGNQQTKLDLDRKAKEYQQRSRSSATRQAYASDWDHFKEWACGLDLMSLPSSPDTVRRYITHLAEIGRSTATISRAIAAIKSQHKDHNHLSPMTQPVVETWQGIRREIGSHQRQAKALVVRDLQTVLNSIRPDFLGRRDAALLLLGWTGALRRSEIVAIDFSHVSFVPDGLILTIPRSKTDQESQGQIVAIPWASDKRYCAVTKLQSWISWSSITGGPLFFAIGMPGRRAHVELNYRKRLTPRMVNQIIRRRMKQALLSPEGYSGHSLRAGFVTSAIEAGTPEALVQIHTRHRNFQTMRSYVRQGSMFSNNPLSALL